MGLGSGGQKFNFLNKIMRHIKLKEVISRPGYTEKIYTRIKLVTLGWGQKVNYTIRFLLECGDFRQCAIKCVLVIFLN